MRYDHLIGVSSVALTLALAPLPAAAADIVQTLKDSGQYSNLMDAIEKAGLTQTLQGEGPFTVFAPTDEAFQKLQQGSQSQQQSSQHSSEGQQQAQSGQSQQQAQSGQGQQTGQGQQQAGGKVLQQASSDQLKGILEHHVVQGQELKAQDLLGKEQKVQTLSGDQLTVDGTGTVMVLVPTGLGIVRVGDEVFVQRETAALAHPAVTVSTTGQQGEQAQQGQQQSSSQSAQQGQQSSSHSGQQGQQQQAAQSGQQGQQATQSGQQGQQQQAAGGQSQSEQQPMAEQQGLLRAAMVVEPNIEADNGVIHGIDQVLVPQKLEQELMSGQPQSGGQQG